MLKIHTNRSDKEKFDPYELYILVLASNLQRLLIFKATG